MALMPRCWVVQITKKAMVDDREQVEEIEKTQQKVVSLPDVMFQFLANGQRECQRSAGRVRCFWHVIRITLIICYDILIDDAATDHMRYCDHCCTNFVSYCHFLFINFILKLIVIVYYFVIPLQCVKALPHCK